MVTIQSITKYKCLFYKSEHGLNASESCRSLARSDHFQQELELKRIVEISIKMVIYDGTFS